MGELGLPEIISKTWNVISAPPKTPPAVLTKLNKLIDEILKSPDVQARFAETHAITEGGSLQYAKQYVLEDRARWSKVIARSDSSRTHAAEPARHNAAPSRGDRLSWRMSRTSSLLLPNGSVQARIQSLCAPTSARGP